MASPRRALSRWRGRLQHVERFRLAFDSMWAMVAQGGRAVTSLGTFLIVTRALGVRDYGLFAGILALATALLSFTNFGAGHVLMQRVSRDGDELPQAWGDALLASAIGTALTLSGVGAFGPLLIPGVAAWTIVALASSELLFVSVGQVVAFAYEARRRFSMSTVVTASYGLVRFLALLLLYLRTPRLELETVAITMFLVALLHGVAAALMLTSVSRPQFDLGRAWRFIRTGSNYMTSQFSTSLQNDVDKTMLVSLGMPAASGIYTAGYRVVTYSLLPVQSLVYATYPRFFRRGQAGGIEDTWGYARRLSKPMVGYGAVTLVLLVVLAAPIASVIGGGYAEVAEVIRYMAALVILQSVRTTLGNALTGANYQTYRTVIIIVAALGNIGLNLLLIPHFSWRGAMIATYISEAFLVIASWSVIQRKRGVEALARSASDPNDSPSRVGDR
jgi:O-antigen/teichoic acid export membrane protein